MRKKIAYFVSHPIQYQAPLLRKITEECDFDLHVFFLSDLSTGAYVDSGFGQSIEWDIPLTDGYSHEFLDSVFESGDFSLKNPKVKLGSVYRAVRQQPWDAVWVHGYGNIALLAVLALARMFKIPYFFRGESNLLCSSPTPLKDKFVTSLVKNARALLWVSSDNRDYYSHYGAHDSQLHFMPYAVDNLAFQQKKVERESADSTNVVTFLFASKFIERKNASLLIEAFAQLPKSHQEQARLKMAGSGPLQAELEKLSTVLGVEDRVQFLGFVNQGDMPRLLSNSDVFVLPSQKEPFGLIVNEAMNLAKPVIVTDQVGCARDLVKSGENGWMVNANDVSSLMSALKSAIERRSTLSTMGVASLAMINNWSYEQDVEGLSKAVQSL